MNCNISWLLRFNGLEKLRLTSSWGFKLTPSSAPSDKDEIQRVVKVFLSTIEAGLLRAKLWRLSWRMLGNLVKMVWRRSEECSEPAKERLGKRRFFHSNTKIHIAKFSCTLACERIFVQTLAVREQKDPDIYDSNHEQH